MKVNPIPSQDYLRLILDYDPCTGKLSWKSRDAASFTATPFKTAEQLRNVWNGKLAGKQAFTSQRRDGYFRSSIDRVELLAHRVVFKMVHGYDPNIVDHDDRDPSNNREHNLIDGSQQNNMTSRRLGTNNKSGHHGVYFDASRAKWEAKIQSHRQSKFLGYFDTRAEAIAARQSSERLHSFHPNHGK